MQDRRKFLRNTSLTAGAVFLLKPFQSVAQVGSVGNVSADTLSILHTAGLNGTWNVGEGHGGLNAVHKAVRSIRKTNQVLLLDAGDVLGNNEAQHTAYLQAMQQAGYDAIAPGTSDMVKGVGYYNQLLEQNQLNAVAIDIKEENILPYHIIRKGKIKVGIVGLSAHADASHIYTINNIAGFLKNNHNCHLVVCLANSGMHTSSLTDVQLAEQTAHIDLIICEAADKQVYNARLVKNKKGYDVIISNAGSKGSLIGRIDFTFNSDSEKITMKSSPVFTGYHQHDQCMAFRKHAATLA